MAAVPHVCPDSNRGMLPVMITDAVTKGNHTKVMTWLKNGGDINAGDMMGRTLVYQTCYFDHPELLRELLKHPDVHLDQWISSSGVPARKRATSPLQEACLRGHVECVEALLTSPSKCQIDLNKNHIASLVNNASKTDQWKIVELFLNAGHPLLIVEAYHLLDTAVKCGERGIINYILKQELTFEKQNLGYIVQEIFNRDLTDAASADTLFKKAISRNNDTAKKMLSLVLEEEDWKRLETLLHVMTGSASINVSLCEAVLGYNAEEVERMLNEEEHEESVRNGTLLVASIGGTTEEIADILLDQKYNHSTGILAHVLILASMYGRLELLPTLLKETSFTYNTLQRAMNVVGKDAGLLLRRAIKKVVRTTIPVEKEMDECDEDDDDEDNEDDNEDSDDDDGDDLISDFKWKMMKLEMEMSQLS